VNRLALSFFFALVAFPFIVVWGGTQGARVLDTLAPIYSVPSVEKIDLTETGVRLTNVTFAKNHACDPEGVMYLSAMVPEGRTVTEVLIPAERAPGVPFVPRGALNPGESGVAPEIRAIVSKDMLGKIERFRFMIPCDRPFAGPTRAYTNFIRMRTGL
jgi:hypothetical protein